MSREEISLAVAHVAPLVRSREDAIAMLLAGQVLLRGSMEEGVTEQFDAVRGRLEVGWDEAQHMAVALDAVCQLSEAFAKSTGRIARDPAGAIARFGGGVVLVAAVARALADRISVLLGPVVTTAAGAPVGTAAPVAAGEDAEAPKAA